MRKVRKMLFFTILLLLAAVEVSAQATDAICPAIVARAFRQLESNCEDVNRNSACYGYENVQATFTDDVDPDYFSQPSDIADLTRLNSIWTTPMDESLGTWGIAVMNVQANVPGTLPGQAVVFLLIGDVRLENAVDGDSLPDIGDPITVSMSYGTNIYAHPASDSRVIYSVLDPVDLQADVVSEDNVWARVIMDEELVGWISLDALEPSRGLDNLPRVNPMRMSPMQAFRFNTGFGQPTCAQQPAGTLMVQGPDNVLVDIEANGARISIGSTIVLSQTPNHEMQMTTLHGTAYVEDVPVPAGYTFVAPLDDQEQVIQESLADVIVRPVTEEELMQQLPMQDVPSDLLHYEIDLDPIGEVAGIELTPEATLDYVASEATENATEEITPETTSIDRTPEVTPEETTPPSETEEAAAASQTEEVTATPEETSASSGFDDTTTPAPEETEDASSTEDSSGAMSGELTPESTP